VIAAIWGRVNRRGMTMMELLIVIVMIGIMAAMVVPRLRASPRRMVQESARQLARDIDLVRERALVSKRATRLKLVGTSAWIAYRDVEGDAVISELAAESDSMRGFGQRTLDPQVLLGRGSATPLSGWPVGDPTSFTSSRLNFKGNGMTLPFGTQGIIYLRHRDDPSVVAAVTVTGAGSVRVWIYRGGTWQ
jgi:prepilin-type N-terminal cleavage/methylation domain-containing protein